MGFRSFLGFLKVMRKAFVSFRQNDPLRMAAATAFFATFALPAILIILIQLFGWVINPKQLSDHLFDHLVPMVGNESVVQIRETLNGFRKLALNPYVTIAGFLFLVFVATTLFKVIKDTLNQLWNIRSNRSSGLLIRLLRRIKSILVIIIAGVLFMAVILGEAAQALLREYADELFPGSGSFLFKVLNQLISVGVVTLWFTVLFKFLPDAQLSWNVAFAGGFFTGILFTAGKLILGWLLALSNIRNVYGASGSFVLLLLFVFYVSFILYYGAMFTHAWAQYKQKAIRPTKYAYLYELTEVKT